MSGSDLSMVILIALVGFGGAVLGSITNIIAANIRYKGSEKIKKDAQRSKQKEKISTEKYRLYTDLVEIYNSTKKIRRMLRAKGLCFNDRNGGLEEKMLIRAVYDEQMEVLVDNQLKLEFYCRYIESHFNIFQEVDHIQESLGSMTKYLGEIISEYEESWSCYTSRSDACLVASLPRIEDFLLPYKQSESYNTQFRSPFVGMLTALENDSTQIQNI